MYILTKPKNRYSSVTLINDLTNQTYTLGQIRIPWLDFISEQEGIKFDYQDPEGLAVSDEWHIEISPETAAGLMKLASPIHKRVKVKSDANPKQALENIKKQANKKVDAMDVLLGLNNYC